MAWGRRKSGPKSAKNQLLYPHLCSFFSPSLSSLFQPPPASPLPAPPQEANTTTNRPLSCHRDSLSSPSSLSLSSATFSSSSHSRLRPSPPQPMPPEPQAKHPHHVRNPQARQLSPPCFTSFFFVEAATCRNEFCMQWQNNSFWLWLGQFWPSLNGWVGSDPTSI